MSSPFLDALGYVGSSLDKPGAALRGLLAGRPDQLLNLVPFGDTLGITSPEERTRGTDLLGLDPDTTGGVLGGMAAEVATDPLNLLFGAGLMRNALRGRALQEGYRSAQAGYEAAEAARPALVEAAGRAEANNALRRELLGSGGMPEEVALQTKAVDASGQPVRTYHGTKTTYDKYDPRFNSNPEDLLYGPGYYTTEDTAQGIAGGYAGHLERRPFMPGEREAAQAELLRRIEATAAADPVRAEALKGTADLSANEFMTTVAMRRALREAGIPYQDLYPHTAPQVRMQYLDYRNPLDMTRNYTVAEQDALGKQLLGQPLFDPSVSSSDLLVSGESLYPDLRMAAGDAPSLGIEGMTKEKFNQLLQDKGFDAIKHPGGVNTGNLPDAVHIVFRPDQIYNPWVAPLEQAMPVIPPPSAIPVPPRLPRQSPLLAALGLQNTLGRAG